MANKCFTCPDCGGKVRKQGPDYYCPKCKEVFSKDYVENRRDYDDDD